MYFFGFVGKLNNIEGIAQSTEDDINRENIDEIAKAATEDYHFVPLSPVPTTKKPLQAKNQLPLGAYTKGTHK